VDEIGELPGKYFAVIIDEAHSSQSGKTAVDLNKTLAKETGCEDEDEDEEWTDEDEIVKIVKGRKMLPNASVAFREKLTAELLCRRNVQNHAKRF